MDCMKMFKAPTDWCIGFKVIDSLQYKLYKSARNLSSSLPLTHNFFFSKSPPQPRARKQAISLDACKILCAANEHEFNMWFAGVRLAKFGMSLREDYESALRQVDQLVKIGAATSGVKEGLQSEVQRNVISQNKDVIREWKAQRSKRGKPGVSAATGVEFDDDDDDDDGADGDGGDGDDKLSALPPKPQDLNKHPWYHGKISRDEAEFIFQDRKFQ